MSQFDDPDRFNIDNDLVLDELFSSQVNAAFDEIAAESVLFDNADHVAGQQDFANAESAYQHQPVDCSASVSLSGETAVIPEDFCSEFSLNQCVICSGTLPEHNPDCPCVTNQTPDLSLDTGPAVIELAIADMSDGVGIGAEAGMTGNDHSYFMFKLAEHWSQDAGVAIPGAVYKLARLPKFYRGVEKTQDATGQVEHHLHGHPNGVFHSAEEAYPHFAWLQGPDYDLPCTCKLCLKTVMPIVQERTFLSQSNGFSSFSPDTQVPSESSKKRYDDRCMKIPRFQGYFNSFQKAREALIPRTGAEMKVQLRVTADDWLAVKSQHLQHYASRIYDALARPAGDPPHDFPPEYRTYFTDHQNAELENAIIPKIMRNCHLAEARAILMMEHIITIHEHGISKSAADRTSVKQGFIPETKYICSERVEQVIAAISQDKYVAGDVLNGVSGLQDLALAPMRYLRRKRENSKVNAKKKADKLAAEEEMKKKNNRGNAGLGATVNGKSVLREKRGIEDEGAGGRGGKRRRT